MAGATAVSAKPLGRAAAGAPGGLASAGLEIGSRGHDSGGLVPGDLGVPPGHTAFTLSAPPVAAPLQAPPAKGASVFKGPGLEQAGPSLPISVPGHADAPQAGPSLPDQGDSAGSPGKDRDRPEADEAAAAKAAALFEDAAVRGKTLLLVGTRSSRPFILEETARVARELGLKLILLDRPENRPHSAALVPDSHFIAAPIDRRDDASMADIVRKVAEISRRSTIDVVAAFRSHHAKLVGRIVGEIRAAGVPKQAVLTADDKAKTREALNSVPELAVPARKIRSAEEARMAFRELGGGKFVMKSNHGENSRFIEMGIDSEEAAERTYRRMEASLKAYAEQSESGSTIFNRYPGILMERMLEQAPGTHESSVELVMQNGRPVFAMVSDTHGIGPAREYAGGSLSFPSQQDAAIQQAFVAAAAKALQVLGIHDGNARVDVIMTPAGARIIEVNPYLGGAAIWKCVKILTGISLVEYGIRALLGLRLDPVPAPSGVVDYRFGASKFTGRLEAVEGLEAARGLPGIAHLQMLASAGDPVAAPEGNSFEEVVEIMGVGSNLEEARGRSLAALRQIKMRVLVEQPGDFLQP